MQNLRKHFLLDPTVTFLNHGSFGATSKPVFKEYQRWQRELEKQPVEFLGRRITGLLAEARTALGEYLGTDASNLIYTQNVTISLNIVARSLELGAGDEVLATDHEYGAMDRTWHFLAKERGFRYINQHIELPLTTPEKVADDLWRGVTPNTRVIFISHITSPTALIFPVQEVVRRAREAGVITIVDGAHVAGQLSLNLDALGADFYGGNLHKWLCAPKGAGFLYARPEVQHLLKPLVVSWGYESLTPSASKFIDHHEWWGTRDMAAFLSVPAAIQFQKEHHWDDVREACHGLARAAQAQLCDLTGVPPLHSQADVWFRQMACVPLPADIDPILLKERLYNEYRIELPVYAWSPLSQKSETSPVYNLLRFSVQGYNTQRDIDRLRRALSELLFG